MTWFRNTRYGSLSGSHAQITHMMWRQSVHVIQKSGMQEGRGRRRCHDAGARRPRGPRRHPPRGMLPPPRRGDLSGHGRTGRARVRMGGAAMTDAGLACHATDRLGRHPPGRRDPGPDATASRRDASGPPVGRLGDHGKEPGSTSTPDPGGRAAGGSPGGLRRAGTPTARPTGDLARQGRSRDARGGRAPPGSRGTGRSSP